MKRLVGTTLALTALVAAGGCDYRGASSLPLPGGAGGGGYTVTAVFDDVTNLVPKETCRVGSVVVGSVESIEMRDDLKVEVVCRIDPEVELAANAVATLRETSLLGERFVALDPPAGEKPTGTLEHGAMLDEADSHVVPNVEVVLGALSAVLNGGGLGNIDTISQELTTALSGSDLGGTTRRFATLVGTLSDHRSEIVAALDAIDRLSAVLGDQRDVIASALDSIPDGLAALDRQRPRLVRTLDALGDLSDVALPLIRDTKAATVRDLELLAPVLEDLAASKHRLAKALEYIVTFPFPSYTKYVTKGDYAGMFATFTLDLDSLNHLLGTQAPQLPELPVQGDDPTTSDDPSLIPGLPDLSDLSLDELLDLLPDLQLPLGGGKHGPEEVDGSSSNDLPETLADLLTGGAR
ncbi:MCE family protein [Nocardioides humilatus]|uniref:MCE family protein n=1 Tax=Nocardioides humilatus TaxID=2607660 RepID=A0A5B1LQF6_9ACTN|nr:MCE family protein [Nocardioides humilatus]KAA1421919.1 MCE family protein [Nocardioides humilatus]